LSIRCEPLDKLEFYLDSKKAWLYTFFSRRLSIDFSHEQRA